MKKHLLFIFTIILSINCYSQISFESGYFVDNSNKKTDCLIKNMDWKNIPSEFEYKLSEKGKVQKMLLHNIKAFGIYNDSKYIKSIVNIDRSSKNIGHLTKTRNPIFNEEELFLKVLIEGKSSLYEYISGNLIRYFYSTENFGIKQLIYKSYKTLEGNIGKNTRYKQQLFNNLKCDNITLNKIDGTDYNKNDLIKLFIEYNKCVGAKTVSFEKTQKRDLFNLTLRPRINSSSLSIQNSLSSSRNVDFGSKSGFSFGIELEYILPINKNKWSIFIEPGYQYFKSEKTTNVSNVSGGKLITSLDYKSIEIPIGFRHYFFINDQSKIFVNASYMILDFSSDSSISFTRGDGSSLGSGSYGNLELTTKDHLNIGLGYKYNDKYSIAINYQANRDVLSNYIYWSSSYETISLIFGYSLF